MNAPRPLFAADVLRAARELIRERGWIASNPVSVPFGADEGPLTVSQAIWRASCVGENVQIHAAAVAVRLVAAELGYQGEWPGFVVIGEWSKREGRTADDVERLFTQTIRRAFNRLFTVIRDGFADEPEEALS